MVCLYYTKFIPMGVIVKVCKKHGPLTEEKCYKEWSKLKDKYYYRCIKCRKKYNRGRWDKVLAIRKKYYYKHKEEELEMSRIWRENNKEWIVNWNKKNKEKIKIQQKSWYIRNALYKTYNDKISWCEETRRDTENERLLQVRCTESSCRKWFSPTNLQVKNRIDALYNDNTYECRFYCSDICKKTCSIFKKSKHKEGLSPHPIRRSSQNEWAELVKERDDYICQICGSTKKIVAHHIESLFENPLESADIDIGITLCRKCHLKVHKEIGCRTVDLTIKSLCEEK
uniref:Putative HNH endonuclease n=1 Tax=viral metagenome TaxID=1070528 RepID=A0A6M3L179_9ZZZZ